MSKEIRTRADLYYKRNPDGEKKLLPPKLKNPVSTRSDSLVCSMPLGGDTYGGCDRGCIYCFVRELESTMFPAFYDDWTPDLVRPADLKTIEAMLKKAESPRAYSNPAIQSFKKRYPFTLGRKSEPLLDMEKNEKTTYVFLEMMANRDYPVFMETQLPQRITDSYQKLLSRFSKVGISGNIIAGSTELMKKLEPKNVPPAIRWKAVKELAQSGFWISACWEPFFGKLNDDDETIGEYARLAADAEVKHVNISFYRSSRPPMARFNFEDAGINYDRLMHYSDEVHWWLRARRALEIFRKHGLQCGTPDWVNLPFESDTVNCCGVDNLFDSYNRFTFQTALDKIKRDGDVYWEYMEKIAKDSVMYDDSYKRMKAIWNHEKGYEKYYGLRDVPGVYPVALDENDNILYTRGSTQEEWDEVSGLKPEFDEVF